MVAPLDEDEVEGVVESIFKLAEFISEEIETDSKYFQKPFSKYFLFYFREFDIVRISAESFIKFFVLTLESRNEIITSDQAVASASKVVFDLYRKVREMDERYAKLIPGYYFFN